MPILEIRDLLFGATLDAHSKYTFIARDAPEINVPVIPGPFWRIHCPLQREFRPLLRLEIEYLQVEIVVSDAEIPAIMRPARHTQTVRSRNLCNLAGREVKDSGINRHTTIVVGRKIIECDLVPVRRPRGRFLVLVVFQERHGRAIALWRHDVVSRSSALAIHSL